MATSITKAADLITPHHKIREGFLDQALAKNRKAEPYMEQAQELRELLSAVDEPARLAWVRVGAIRELLCAAAGLSDKARAHLTDEEVDGVLREVFGRIVNSAGDGWGDEIVFRFLLTRGDTLGGSMRNYTGARGGARLTSFILGALKSRGTQPEVESSPTNSEKIRRIAWKNREIHFDKKPPFISKNIDVIVVDANAGIEVPIACGELKGGIDPAGADEHWKTARSALNRIRESFADSNRPKLFFVAAAIEAAMAGEIFQELQEGKLAFAANLTNETQLSELVGWLLEL